jgi:hypothetical protein
MDIETSPTSPHRMLTCGAVTVMIYDNQEEYSYERDPLLYSTGHKEASRLERYSSPQAYWLGPI